MKQPFLSKPGSGPVPYSDWLSKRDQERLGVVPVPDPLTRDEASAVLESAAQTKRGAVYRTEVYTKRGKVETREFKEPKR